METNWVEIGDQKEQKHTEYSVGIIFLFYKIRVNLLRIWMHTLKERVIYALACI